VSAAVRETAAEGGTLTLSGARTGIVGGAVPVETGNLLSLERMEGGIRLFYSEERGAWAASVPPSLTLDGLRAAFSLGSYRSEREAPHSLQYPVDPTETSASLGGMAATNASGARTLFYGPTRDWVLGLTIVLADGRVAVLKRGAPAHRRAPSQGLRFSATGADGDVREIQIGLPDITMPATKHVAGYYVSPRMEPMDLFIGGEGTLGIISGLEIALTDAPKGLLGVCVFLPDHHALFPLLARIKASTRFTPLALEYMDENSLSLLAAFRSEAGESSGIPSMPKGGGGMLYIEASFETETQADGIMEELADALARGRISEDSTWAAFGADELEAMRNLRHALPERVNSLVARTSAGLPGITKLATDLAVPEAGFPAMMDRYATLLGESGLSYVLFGHIGNFHLHMNILPASLDEMERGRGVCGELARACVTLGGSVSGEHGLGKLKRHLLAIQYGATALEGMGAIKNRLDPAGLLNPGVLWDRAP
jgi:D-lactate dehydrogenase (cytochrome)